MPKLTNLIAVLALFLFLLAGCSQQDNPAGAVDSETKEISDDAWVKIPAAAGLDSAFLFLTVSMNNGETVYVHRITSAWNEANVTWDNFNSSYDELPEAAFVPDSYAEIRIDVTSLAAKWFNGVYPNHGMLLRQGASVSQYRSSEFFEVSSRPRLELFVSTPSGPQSFGIQETGLGEAEDAFIGGNFPTGNNGSADMLMVGNTFGFEQNALIKFNFVVEEPEEYCSIGDLVWEDLNFNGLQDPGEPGLADVRVDLYSCDGQMVEGALTTPEGYFLFDSLELGEYYLIFHIPPDYVFSIYDQGGNDNIDSDADPAMGATVCFAITAPGKYTSWDAGFYLPTIDDDDDDGCTRGMGYWKNLCRNPSDKLITDDAGVFLPLWLGTEGGQNSIRIGTIDEAEQIFTFEDDKTSNGIVKLCAHLLAAKFNLANGAGGDDISQELADADQFLAQYGFEHWQEMSDEDRRLILIWKDTFEAFNEGEIGPGACPEDQDGDDIESSSAH